jgi:hypothetical protein
VVLVLGVLQHLLGFARPAQRLDLALHQRNRTTGDVRGRLGDGVRTGQVGPRVGRAAELLDPTLELLGVVLRLPQVLLKALLVRRAGGHPDVRLQRGLELLLLAVGLVQVLNDLGVFDVPVVSHVAESPFSLPS